MSATLKYAPQPEATKDSHYRIGPLYVAAGISAFSGIAYELLLATYATFLMGATIFQYSLVLSLMMASMGLGSLLADRVGSNPLAAFLATEVVISIIAVVALPTLYFAYARGLFPSVLLMLFVVGMGGAIGMEIPLLNRITGSAPGSEGKLSHLLFYDYLGGFLGGMVFPLLLIPNLSLFQIAGVLGVINSSVGGVFAVGYRKHLGASAGKWIAVAIGLLAFSGAFCFWAEPLRILMEHRLFGIEGNGIEGNG
jgi:spermidine synthase